MRSEKGTYAVIFQCRSKATQQVGQWGMISLREGYYVYVGSAFGPGGVKARVSHHYHNTKKPHWHIDYLRRFMCPVTVWYTYDHRRLEHRWAKVFLKMNNMSPFQGFGCSDCDCYSHLFFTFEKPEPALFTPPDVLRKQTRQTFILLGIKKGRFDCRSGDTSYSTGSSS